MENAAIECSGKPSERAFQVGPSSHGHRGEKAESGNEFRVTSGLLQKLRVFSRETCGTLVLHRQVPDAVSVERRRKGAAAIKGAYYPQGKHCADTFLARTAIEQVPCGFILNCHEVLDGTNTQIIQGDPMISEVESLADPRRLGPVMDESGRFCGPERIYLRMASPRDRIGVGVRRGNKNVFQEPLEDETDARKRGSVRGPAPLAAESSAYGIERIQRTEVRGNGHEPHSHAICHLPRPIRDPPEETLFREGNVETVHQQEPGDPALPMLLPQVSKERVKRIYTKREERTGFHPAVFRPLHPVRGNGNRRVPPIPGVPDPHDIVHAAEQLFGNDAVNVKGLSRVDGEGKERSQKRVSLRDTPVTEPGMEPIPESEARERVPFAHHRRDFNRVADVAFHNISNCHGRVCFPFSEWHTAIMGSLDSECRPIPTEPRPLGLSSEKLDCLPAALRSGPFQRSVPCP